MPHDVIIIGGSYAGMAAALQLVRARRSVLIVDAGQRRNRFAAHSHGFLTQDGADPAVIAATARRQLEAYPTLAIIEGKATAITGERDAFSVTLATGEAHQGWRILLAIGLSDTLPPVEGLAERWGRSVFHCPYCHGYELDQGAIGVIGAGPLSVQQAELLAEWGRVTLLPNGALDLDEGQRATLAAKGVAIEDIPIARLEGDAEICLTDGRTLHFAGLFVGPRVAPVGTLATDAGCALEDTMMGVMIRTGPTKETTVPGIFAAGDAAFMPQSVTFAVGDGALAGMQIHRSLVWP